MWGTAILTVLIFSFIFINPISVLAESQDPGALLIDPESISGENEKEGSILAEYGFSFFTEESMSEMQAVKEKEEQARQDTVDGLFSNEWNEIDNYDKYVNEVIKAGNLFSNVNTGVETVSEVDNGYDSISKWIKIGATGMLMCLISIIVIIYRRKRHEHKYNN